MECPVCHQENLHTVLYSDVLLGYVCRDGCHAILDLGWEPDFVEGMNRIFLTARDDATNTKYPLDTVLFTND